MRWRVRSDFVPLRAVEARAFAIGSDPYRSRRRAVNDGPRSHRRCDPPCAGRRGCGTSPPVELAERLQAYVASRLPRAEDVTVSNLDRIFGGGSRETYRFVVTYREGGRDVARRLILRRDPPASLIETQRRVEFAAYRAFFGTRVPVPEPLWLEEDPQHLDHPFFIMEEITGCEA